MRVAAITADRSGSRRSSSGVGTHRIKTRAPVSRVSSLVGSKPSRSKKLGVTLHPRAVGARGRSISFSDGSTLDVDGVIWATGFRSDYSWIDLPITGLDGRVEHHRGVTDFAGLYFLGLQWQWTRGSALLGFVKNDASYLAARISEFAADNKETDATARRPAALAAQGD